MLERFSQLITRFGEYSVLEVVLELAVIWVIVFVVFRFVRGTRAAGALQGLLIILILSTLVASVLGQFGLFPRLTFLYNAFLGLAAIVLVVTFQPELRRAFIRLGEANLFGGAGVDQHATIDAVVDACTFLSKNKFGAIIAIERTAGLREAVETGKSINADISSHLLNSIFWPSSPLHDMGVVVRGNKVLAASVPFPLVEPWEMPDQNLGTRHRAALGLARTSDALVVVVSEETGAISLAEGRTLTRWLTPDKLRAELADRLLTQESGPPVVQDAEQEVSSQAKRLAGEPGQDAPASDAGTKADTTKSHTTKSDTTRGDAA